MTIRRITFPTGLDNVVRGWTSGAFGFGLFTDSWVQNEMADVYLSAITAFEFTDPTYGRQVVAAPVKDVVLPAAAAAPGYLEYKCTDPDFGVISGGEIASALVLYAFVSSDADSPIVAAYPCYYVADGAADAAFVLSSFGAVTVSTICPEAF